MSICISHEQWQLNSGFKYKPQEPWDVVYLLTFSIKSQRCMQVNIRFGPTDPSWDMKCSNLFWWSFFFEPPKLEEINHCHGGMFCFYQFPAFRRKEFMEGFFSDKKLRILELFEHVIKATDIITCFKWKFWHVQALLSLSWIYHTDGSDVGGANFIAYQVLVSCMSPSKSVM